MPSTSLTSRSVLFSRVSAMLAMVTGLLALAGWLLDVDALRSVLPGAVGMKANTALCLIAAGSALLCLQAPASATRIRAAHGLAVLVIAIAGLSLLEYFFGLDFHIDQLLFIDRTQAALTTAAGRMAPVTALCLLLTGLALVLMDGWPPASEKMALVVALLGLLSLTGYLFDAPALYRVRSSIPIAANTASALFLLGLGIVAARPARGLPKIVLSSTPAGFIVRRFVLWCPPIFIGLGLLTVLGVHAGLMDHQFSAAVLALSCLMTTFIFTFILSRRLHGVDKDRLRYAQQLTELNASLEAQVALRTSALQKSEVRYRSLFESMADAVLVMDKGIIMDCNPEALRIFGVASRLGILGKTPSDLSPAMQPGGESSRDAARRFTREAMTAGTAAFDWQHLRQDTGEPFMAEVRLAQTEIDGAAFQQATVRDVTHQRELESRLRGAKRRAEAANAELSRHRDHLEELVEARTLELAQARDAADAASRAKSTFLATMSHEIRTPMNAIIGFSQMLRKKLLDRQQLEWADKVIAAGNHLLAIINDILDFSKIEADRLTLAQDRTDLRAVADQVMALLDQPARSKGLRLACEMASDPPVLLADATRLTQAFLNLANNAVKFTRQGSVTLRVTATDESDGVVLVRFEVQDTGMGIAPQDQIKLFQPFQQADGSATRSAGGTGLGLAITRRLAELMGGQAGFSSAPGLGSTFWFTARLHKAQPGTEQTVAEDAADAMEDRLKQNFRGTRILLAEDDPINQEVGRFQLEDLGLHVEVAGDGAQAVEMASKAAAAGQPYALVLMDVQMPGMDGLQATQALRQAGLTLPVIAMTANAFAEDRVRCLDAGMSDFISKPVDPGKLHAALLKWIAA